MRIALCTVYLTMELDWIGHPPAMILTYRFPWLQVSMWRRSSSRISSLRSGTSADNRSYAHYGNTITSTHKVLWKHYYLNTQGTVETLLPQHTGYCGNTITSTHRVHPHPSFPVLSWVHIRDILSVTIHCKPVPESFRVELL